MSKKQKTKNIIPLEIPEYPFEVGNVVYTFRAPTFEDFNKMATGTSDIDFLYDLLDTPEITKKDFIKVFPMPLIRKVRIRILEDILPESQLKNL